MMRGMGNMQGMMKQVQKMQKEMVKAQEALNEKEFVGESTNSYVKVHGTGDKKITEIIIDPAIIDSEDPEMLQDLIVMAVNDIITKIEVETEAVMGKYTKGMPGF